MNSVATSSSSAILVGKRKNGSFSEELESPTKKLCTVSNNWYFVLASESEIDTDEGTESICSLQNKSTDWAKDTSDTSSKSGWSSDPGFEYEVASLSDDELPNPFTQYNQDSYSSGTDTELVCSVTLTLDHGNDNDDSWADSSSVSSEMDDPELSRADFWTCVKCKAQNNNPMFRYCEKCFKVRKNFFPPRPRRKNKKIRQNRPRKRKSYFEESVQNMAKVRKEDGMTDVTSAQTSVNKPSSSGASHDVLEHGSSSQETIVPCDYLQTNKNTDEVITQKTVKTLCEETVELSAVDHMGSSYTNVGEKETDNSRSEDLSSSGVGNSSTETIVALSGVSQMCEFNKADQCVREDKGESGKSRGEFYQKNEHWLSQETVSTSYCSEDRGNSEVCLSNMKIERESQKNYCGETLSQETVILSQESAISEGSITSGLGTSSFEASNQSVSDNSICNTCMVNPKNGAFVHGKTAHIYCCYKCSLKVWMQTGRCPICNAKVRQVLKAVIV